MFQRIAATAFAAIALVGPAFAASAPTEEREFPLAIVFALIAVFFGAGTAIFAASQRKKKDGE